MVDYGVTDTIVVVIIITVLLLVNLLSLFLGWCNFTLHCNRRDIWPIKYLLIHCVAHPNLI